MKSRLRKYWIITRKTFQEFGKANPMNYGAAIAFYTILSLPAILLIAVNVAGSIYEENVVRQELFTQIECLLGAQSAERAASVLENASQGRSGFLARIIGIVTLVVSATTVFVSIQNSLNAIWDIRAKPKRGMVKFVTIRLLSFAMVVSLGFLLMVSLLMDTVLVIFGNFMQELFSGLTYYLVAGLNLAISLGVITLIFALIFKVLPDARVRWQDVWIGALTTTLMFTLGKYLIGFLLGNSPITQAYGAAGSLVVLLLWVYFSSILLLLGAQFTYIYSREYGAGIIPNKQAVRVRYQELPPDELLEEREAEDESEASLSENRPHNSKNQKK